MRVTCSICTAIHEVADAQLSNRVTQTICQNCGSNLVFIRPSEGHKRRKVLGFALFVLLVLLNYGIVGAVAYFGMNIIYESDGGSDEKLPPMPSSAARDGRSCI